MRWSRPASSSPARWRSWFGWSWLDPAVSLVDRARHRARHLEPVPAVAAPAVRRRAGGHRPRMRCAASSRRCPASTRVHDLHVWATGTTETALTAHLVMPHGHADDRFLEDATRRLQAQFRIGHVTLQVVREPFMALCAGPTGACHRQDATGPRTNRSGQGRSHHEVQGLLRSARRRARRDAGRDQAAPTASSRASTTRTSARCPTPKPASRTSTRPTKCCAIRRSAPPTTEHGQPVPRPARTSSRRRTGMPDSSSAAAATRPAPRPTSTRATSSRRCSGATRAQAGGRRAPAARRAARTTTPRS